MPLSVNNLAGFGAKRAAAGGGSYSGPADISFVSSHVDSSGVATYTFSSIAWANPETGRFIVVAVGWEDGAGGITIDSATIGGETASILNSGIEGDRAFAGIIGVRLDSGTSGSVSITFSAAVDCCGIGVWELTGADGITPSDTDPQTADPSTGLSFTLDIPADGCAIAFTFNGVQGTSVTWSGTGVAERYDEDLAAGALQSGADIGTSASARSAHSISTSHSSSLQGSAGIAASWASI